MGDKNQLLFVKTFINELKGPYLEVGSKDYGSTQNLRTIFAPINDKYLGIDIDEGKGVDIVLDLTQDFNIIDKKLNGERFGTIFCLSVLEHCKQPFVMAENLTRLLKNKGKIVISVPFAWKYHGYPVDYWRFTCEGVKTLFPKLSFDPNKSIAATSIYKEFNSIDGNIGRIPFSFGFHFKRGHVLRGIAAKAFKWLSKVGFFRWLGGYSYVLSPTNIFMIGEL